MGASGTGGPRPDRVIAPYDDGTAVLAVDVGATRTRLATLVGGRIVERAEHLTADLAILGENKVNIATFHLGRDKPGGSAIALVQVDQPISSVLLDKIAAVEGVVQAKVLGF